MSSSGRGRLLKLRNLIGRLFDTYDSSIETKHDFLLSFFKVFMLLQTVKQNGKQLGINLAQLGITHLIWREILRNL